VQILDGLSVDDQVITAGQMKLRDGVAVDAAQAATATAGPMPSSGQ
jgi:hypothetical protein